METDSPNLSAAVRAKALYDYEAQRPDELSLSTGVQLEVLQQTQEGGWWFGRLNQQEGWFPANYVELLAEEPNENVHEPGTRAVVRQVFQATRPDELSLGLEDAVHLLQTPSRGDRWNGTVIAGKTARTGWFPRGCVEAIPEPASASLKRSSTVSSQGSSASKWSAKKPWFQKLVSQKNAGPGGGDDLNAVQEDGQEEEPAALSKETSSPVFASNSKESRRTSLFVPNSSASDSRRPSFEGKSSSSGRRASIAGAISFNMGDENKTEERQNRPVISRAETPVREDTQPAIVVRKTWRDCLTKEEIETMAPKDRKRQDAIWELMNTEADYVNDVKLIVHTFMKPMIEKKVLQPKLIQLLFQNIEEILTLNSNFLVRLETARDMDGPLIERIGGLLLESAEKLIIYTQYCSERNQAIAKLQSLITSNKPFKNFLDDIYKSNVTRGMDLASFLIKPVQRICKYPLLIREIIKHTEESHPDRKELDLSYQQTQNVMTLVNQGTAQVVDGSKRVLELQSNITDKVDLVSPNRYIVREDPISVVYENGKKPHKLVLFNDMILVLRKDWRDKFDLVASALLVSIHLSDITSDKNTMVEIELPGKIPGGPYDHLIASFNSKAIKTAWIDAVKALIGININSKAFKSEMVSSHNLSLPYDDGPATPGSTRESAFESTPPTLHRYTKSPLSMNISHANTKDIDVFVQGAQKNVDVPLSPIAHLFKENDDAYSHTNDASSSKATNSERTSKGTDSERNSGNTPTLSVTFEKTPAQPPAISTSLTSAPDGTPTDTNASYATGNQAIKELKLDSGKKSLSSQDVAQSLKPALIQTQLAPQTGPTTRTLEQSRKSIVSAHIPASNISTPLIASTTPAIDITLGGNSALSKSITLSPPASPQRSLTRPPSSIVPANLSISSQEKKDSTSTSLTGFTDNSVSDQLLQRISELEQVNRTQKTESVGLKNDIVLLNRVVASLKSEISSSQTNHQSTLTMLTSQIELLRSEKNRLETTLSEERDEYQKNLLKLRVESGKKAENEADQLRQVSDAAISSLKKQLDEAKDIIKKKDDNLVKMEQDRLELVANFTSDPNVKVGIRDVDVMRRQLADLFIAIRAQTVSNGRLQTEHESSMIELHSVLDQNRNTAEQRVLDFSRKVESYHAMTHDREIEYLKKDAALESSQNAQRVQKMEINRMAEENRKLKKQNDEQGNKIKTLESNDDANKVLLIDYQKRISVLEDEINQKNQDFEYLRKEKSDNFAKLAELDSLIAKFNSEIQERDQRLETAKQELDINKEAFSELETLLNESQSECDRLKFIEKEHISLTLEHQQLAEEAIKLRETAEEHSKLKRAYEKVTNEYDEARDKFTTSIEFASVAGNKLSTLKNELASTKKELALVSAREKDLSEKWAALSRVQESSSAHVTHTLESLASLQKYKQDTEEELMDLRFKMKAAAALKKRWKEVEAEKEELVKKVADLSQEVEKSKLFSAILEDLKSVFLPENRAALHDQELLLSLVEKIHMINHEREKLAGELDSFKSKCQQLEAAKAMQDDLSIHLESDLRELQQKAENELLKVESIEAANHDWVQKYTALQKQFIALQTQLAEYEDRIEEAESELLITKSEIRVAQEDNHFLKNFAVKSEELQKQLAQAKKDAALLNQENRDLKTVISILKTKFSGSKKQILQQQQRSLDDALSQVFHHSNTPGQKKLSFSKSLPVPSSLPYQTLGSKMPELLDRIKRCFATIDSLSKLHYGYEKEVSQMISPEDSNLSASMSLHFIENITKLDNLSSTTHKVFDHDISTMREDLTQLAHDINILCQADAKTQQNLRDQVNLLNQELRETLRTVSDLRKFNGSLNESVKKSQQQLSAPEKFNDQEIMELISIASETVKYLRQYTLPNQNVEIAEPDVTGTKEDEPEKDNIPLAHKLRDQINVLKELFKVIPSRFISNAMIADDAVSKMTREDLEATVLASRQETQRLSKDIETAQSDLEKYRQAIEQRHADFIKIRDACQHLQQLLRDKNQELMHTKTVLKQREAELGDISAERANISRMVIQAFDDLEDLVVE